MPRRRRALLLSAVALLMLASAAGKKQKSEKQKPEKPEKHGAGLLLCSGGKVLLLLRRSKHHDNAWGWPGGNVEPGDGGDLLATATREAHEEMGCVPPFQVKAQLRLRRGEQGQKHFSVFVCEVPVVARQNWAPMLNSEHREWRWVEWSELAGLELHPWVSIVYKQHRADVRAAAPGCFAPAAAAGGRG